MPNRTPIVKQVTSTQFEVNPAGDGYEVLDTTTGHQVDTGLSYTAATEQAQNLNGSFAYSRKALEGALGCTESEPAWA